MHIPSSTSHWPSLRIPLLLILLWWLLLFLLLMWTQRREDAYTEELARLQLETLYSSIVDMRDWNAQNGGIFVPENPESPANPWIPAEKRALYTADGQRLVKINPAYMVRLISENFRSTIAGFRIIALAPKRPGNRADAWEEAALKSFDDRHTERFELVRSKEPQFRALAALHAKKSCLECHEDAGEGDLLGGISLTLEAAPLRQAGQARKTAAAQAFGLIGLVGTLGIGGATWQLNRKKEKAEAANRLKSAFLANMTHDMRTPLTGMLGMAELLAQDSAEPRRRYLLEHLRDAASSLLGVVDGVMRYSLLEADRQPVRNEPFRPAEEVTVCLDAIRPTCDAKGLKLECSVNPDVPCVLIGDAFRLRQALGNVLGNAVKFTEHGCVSLGVSRENGNSNDCLLRFEVRDTGPGIPLCDRERIFESFEQGSRRAQSERGVGLGLASARLIARSGGGDLTLEESSGQGSVFLLRLNFLLPAPHHAATTGDAPSPCAGKPSAVQVSQRGREGRKGDVLVVEDTPVSALFLHEALEGAGYSAHMADKGSDALCLLRSRHIDAVILDLGLPDMDGLDLARHIRTGQSGADAGTPVLLLSALPLSVNTQSKLPEVTAGCRFLLKPASMRQLLETIESMLPAPGKSDEENNIATRAEARTVLPTETPAQISRKTCTKAFMDDGVFSRHDALDTTDGNVPLLQHMIGAFLEEAPALASVLENASLSSVELCKTAHSLKNSAALLGLPRLRATCAALENALGAAPAPENAAHPEHAPALRTDLNAGADTDAVKNSLRADCLRELKRALAALRREQERANGPLAGDR